jgi:ferredoxin
MKVSVDQDLCPGCGLCTDSVPDVFEMQDDTAKAVKPDVPSELEDDVREAADDCPVEAIIVEE